MERREFLRRAALAAAGTSLAPGALAQVGQLVGARASAAPVPAGFGICAQAYGGTSREQLVQYLEGAVGRRFTTVHNRMGWPVSLVNRYSRWIVSTGHTPILTWQSHSSTVNVRWSAIAAGHHDDRIRSEAAAVAALDRDVYFCFHHEPENDQTLGTPEDWRRAYDRVYELFDQEGATRVRHVACLMASTFKGLNGGEGSWLPRRFDVLGVDGYNRNSGGRWRSFSDIFRPAYERSVALSKPMYVIEHGCVEGAPGQKAQWFADAASTVAAWPNLVGVSYNHEGSGSGSYRVDTSTSSVAGFRAMGTLDRFTAR
jgi:hypothetical protein